MVGETLAKSGIDPTLDWKGTVKLADGTLVEVGDVVESLPRAPADYDLDSVAEITSAPKELIERLAKDIATTTPSFDSSGRRHQPLVPCDRGQPRRLPAAHAHRQHRQARRGLPRLGRQLQGRAVPRQQADRPGLQGLDHAEDPFEQNLDPKAHGRDITRTATPRTKNRPTGTTATAR
jgi:hypothetical protein